MVCHNKYMRVFTFTITEQSLLCTVLSDLTTNSNYRQTLGRDHIHNLVSLFKGQRAKCQSWIYGLLWLACISWAWKYVVID